jgi:hypothetical protein
MVVLKLTCVSYHLIFAISLFVISCNNTIFMSCRYTKSVIILSLVADVHPLMFAEAILITRSIVTYLLSSLLLIIEPPPSAVLTQPFVLDDLLPSSCVLVDGLV